MLRTLVISLTATTLLSACSMSEETVEIEPIEQPEVTEMVVEGPEYSSVEYFINQVGDRVYFDYDKAELTLDAQDVLRAQAKWLVENSTSNITVEGHADERGTREYNLALGARRANTIKRYLASLGVASTSINTVSFGKERPIAPCSQERCWRLNRRGVVNLQPVL